MTYWSSHWKQAVMDSEQSFRNHGTTEEELRAFEEPLERLRSRRGKAAVGAVQERDQDRPLQRTAKRQDVDRVENTGSGR